MSGVYATILPVISSAQRPQILNAVTNYIRLANEFRGYYHEQHVVKQLLKDTASQFKMMDLLETSGVLKKAMDDLKANKAPRLLKTTIK